VGNIYDEGSGKNSKCLSTCVSETKPKLLGIPKKKGGLSIYCVGKPNPMCVYLKKEKKKKKKKKKKYL